MISKTIFITGVHHTPAIELINQLSADPAISWKIFYLSHTRASDTHLSHTLTRLNITYHSLVTAKLDRRHKWFSIVKFPLNLLGLIQTLYLIIVNKPSLVISFGGYVSVPVITAAWIARRPSIVHEQTLTPSLSLKLTAPLATKIALSISSPELSSALPKSKTVITGNLLRSEIFKSKTTSFTKLIPRLKTHPLIYITGGSQGSLFINQLIWQCLPQLTRYTIIHQLGKNLPPPSALGYANYFPEEYIGLYDIGWVLNRSLLVITRAGANTCQELAALRKSAVIIPHPFTQQNEQILNARWLASLLPGQIIILPQNSQLTPKKLTASVKSLLNSPSLAQNYSPSYPKPHPFVKLINEII